MIDKCNIIMANAGSEPFNFNNVLSWVEDDSSLANRCIEWLLSNNLIDTLDASDGERQFISHDAMVDNMANIDSSQTGEISIINKEFAQTGDSTATNSLGMRHMQQLAYAKRQSQRLLIKAPPASGKSRALMFIALDKLHNQGIKKVIVSVPERSIGASFRSTDLRSHGFSYNWIVADKNDLCTDDGLTDKSKTKSFARFLKSNDPGDNILICTHATLRYAFESTALSLFNNCLIAIDEFHHVSTSDGSVLGKVLRDIMQETNAHVVAMTGTYFRGDAISILSPADEETFDKCTYTYYEQLNGYKYLKTLGIGYYFYTGGYLDDIANVINLRRKTIIYLPNVNSSASGKMSKLQQVDEIYDQIGALVGTDPVTMVDTVQTRDGTRLKIANLVDDDSKHREPLRKYIYNNAQTNRDALDIIIALGMAKEGFDWPFCEDVLTIGNRGSFTETIQIIGRCTRDSIGKSHAQFTNLLPKPVGTQDEIVASVNNMLKAICAALLMEQVMAPQFRYSPVDNHNAKAGTIKVKGLTQPRTERGQRIVDDDLDDLIADYAMDPRVQRASVLDISGEPLKFIESDVIRRRYPDLDDHDTEAIRQHLATKMALANAKVVPDSATGKQFIVLANKFTNIDNLDINLIDSVNPFYHAFDVLSRKLNKQTFRTVKMVIDSENATLTDDEAYSLVEPLDKFYRENGRNPSRTADSSYERLLANAQSYLVRRISENERINNDKQ